MTDRKKTHPVTMALAISMVLGMGWCFKAAIKGERPGRAKATAIDAAKTLPWVADVRSKCRAYRAAPNDIKRSEIYRAVAFSLKAVRIKQAKGRLAVLATTQGGDELRLVIEVGEVTLQTESLFGPIKRGSRVYKQASGLREGSCVVFSARGVKPASMMERSMVCDLDYFARFTSVAGCGG